MLNNTSRTTRVLAIACAVLLVVAVLLGIYAGQQRAKANKAERAVTDAAGTVALLKFQNSQMQTELKSTMDQSDDLLNEMQGYREREDTCQHLAPIAEYYFEAGRAILDSRYKLANDKLNAANDELDQAGYPQDLYSLTSYCSTTGLAD